MSQEIDPSAVAGRMHAGSLLLDVREPDEWQESHVAGALHIPLGDLPGRLGELPADREIICMCRSGRRSEKAQHLLEKSARTAPVINMTGGILRWTELGLPVTQ